MLKLIREFLKYGEDCKNWERFNKVWSNPEFKGWFKQPTGQMFNNYLLDLLNVEMQATCRGAIEDFHFNKGRISMLNYILNKIQIELREEEKDGKPK